MVPEPKVPAYENWWTWKFTGRINNQRYLQLKDQLGMYVINIGGIFFKIKNIWQQEGGSIGYGRITRIDDEER